MKVKIDPQRCQGHNRCCLISEEMFEVDEYGLAHALNDGKVPVRFKDKVQLAVDNCPEFAISIVEG